ncbi:helix-turn-helix domain-containing protein [Aquisalinus flavus]|nr:AraC family transcriptional regulator [Aquisalinus flavus]MBD0427798.1 helix-turn-helix transcriptional regulator [Aquisalinus flavus]
MIALSAANVAIAAAGTLLALRSDKGVRLRLASVLACLAGIAALPLIATFARGLYEFYLPLVLPMLLALPPAIYLYVSEHTAERSTGMPSWRHAAMPLAGLGIALGYWLLPAASRSTMLVDGALPEGVMPAALAFLTFTLVLLWCLSSFGYLAMVIRKLRSFRARLKDQYSNLYQRELRWIDWLTVMIVVLWCLSAITIVSDNLGPGRLFADEATLALAAGVLLFLIVFATAPASRQEAVADMPGQASDELPKGKYERSALSPEIADTIAGRIEAAMSQGQLYLDPDLSLQQLSRYVRAAPHHVSQTLNERMGTTFFDFVSHWRIERAKHLLTSDKSSILAIAHDVGFNSRSTFYKAFRKETGTTPRAFVTGKNAPL